MSRKVDARVGDLIAGRYRLEETIGQGGMGRVFRAVDETLSREVAVKILLPQFAVQDGSRQRFTREAKVTATLSHPSAISIYDFGTDSRRLYIVMELLRGRTLRAELGECHQLAPETAVAIAHQIADVLAMAHKLPLIHRDLKPENIMLRGTSDETKPEVVVLDFGMAFIADDESAREKGMGRLTVDGLAGGTPAYMSPEQISGEEATGASDIYSLGCVLFEMLGGMPPFDGPMMKLLTKHMYQPAPDLRPHCPEAPQALLELVERMLKKVPSQRPSAETVCTRLTALAPNTRGARERSRDDAFLATREERMIAAPEAPPPTAAEPLSVQASVDLAEEVRIALASAAINVVEEGGDVDLIDGSDIEAVAQACATSSVPVVAVSDSVEIDVVSKLLRAGIAEIVTAPLATDELVRKLRRAARKKR